MSIVLFNSTTIGNKKDVVEMGGGYPRIGIASIAAYLQEKNIDVQILDPEVDGLSLEKIKDKVQEIQPDIIGLPAYTEEIHDAAFIAKGIKEVCPDTTIVIGGPHASAIPAETLKEFSSFDIAVIGEGESTFLDVVLKKDAKDIAGVAYREDGHIRLNEERPIISDLNSLPLPAWHLYDLDKYCGQSLASGFGKAKGRQLELPIEGARGCPFKCIFCHRINGKIIRFRSPKRVIDDVERYVREFGTNKIYFTEGTFGVNRKLTIEMCDEIIKRGLEKEITWSTGARVDIDAAILRRMKDAGCSFIGFGVESGDPEILNRIGKNIHPEQTIRIFELCREIGMQTEANFILGLPYETKETVLKTIQLASKLKADYANFAILVPFPGTKVYDMACNNEGGLKIKSRDWRVYGKQIGEALENERLPHKELKRLQMKAYRSFYLRPGRIGVLVERMSFKRLVYGLKHIV